MRKKLILIIILTILLIVPTNILISSEKSEYKPAAPYAFDIQKYVWNGSNWTTDYPTAGYGDTIAFKVVLDVIGDTTWYNITFRDVHYDALYDYVESSSRIELFNGTIVAREPFDMPWNTADCSNVGHGSLVWNMTHSESLQPHPALVACIVLYFNITLINANYSKDICWAYFCLVENQYWDSTEYGYTYPVFAGDKFNESITCNINTDETSDWIFSEHVHRNCTICGDDCFDENWTKYETYYYTWYPYNQSLDNDIWVNWAWVMRYNNSNGTFGHIPEDENNLSYVMANNTSMNRSEGYTRMRYILNLSEQGVGNEPFVGEIYYYKDNDNFDMVLYSYNYVALLSKKNGTLVNTADDTHVTTQSTVINYMNDNWVTNSSWGPMTLDPWLYGEWTKYLYNEYTGRLQVKAWDAMGGVLKEPPGWIVDEQIVPHYNASCFGLVVWNPNQCNFTADFDFINEWKVNYTQNKSHSDHNSTFGLNYTAPYMYFKAINYTHYWDDMFSYWFPTFWDYWFLGITTASDYVDDSYCFYRNFSEKFTFNSRNARVNISSMMPGPGDDQNDSIYYYSAVKTNATGGSYKNELVLHIEDTTDGTVDTWDAALVAIDVDNDHIWGDNDKVFLWEWDDFALATKYTIYNGTTRWKFGTVGADPDVTAWFEIWYPNSSFYWQYSYQSPLPALHRYNTHVLYDAFIPLYYFEKGYQGSGNYLTENDTFGLHIMTIPWDDYAGYPDKAVVWENYDEAHDSTLLTEDVHVGMEEENQMSTWDVYMNISNVMELSNFWMWGVWNGVTNNEMQFWGHGKLGNETGFISETFWSTETNKTSNVTAINDITVANHLWYNISIYNNGEQVIDNLIANDTFAYGVTFVDCTLPPGNVTNPYDNCYIFNLSPNLAVGEWFNFTIHVTVVAMAAGNGSYIYNFINVTNNQTANSSANCFVKYGLNELPEVLWQYPVHGNLTTPIPLTNISLGVVDANGDMMNLSIYTNKSSDSWTPIFNDIGSNSSVFNGTYMCNQTFNNTQRFNTRWRWGYTVYYWFVNISDGSGWTNETYYFRTKESRYDINLDTEVNVLDLSMDWANNWLSYDCLGLYDVDANDIVNVLDLSTIWAHSTV
jgi:hypothetical protein